MQQLAGTELQLRLPSFVWSALTWNDVLLGVAFLALPQIPLTLGNALIAIGEENNRLFPDRPVSERKVALSTGIINIAGSAIGGVPMCHGAGGMAGHVAFGARTGGAPIILGVVLLLALFFSGSVETLLKLLPAPVLGVVLFLTGLQLALGSCDFSRNKGERFVTLATAGFALWNVGVALLIGLTLAWLQRRGRLRL